nr:hypothetical protein Iba_chr12cCG11940 [Ipomoea batatas]GMD70494.1 hypothetical protein Iba_chr12eCG6840 [Ipomoea batatas]
MQKQSNLEKNPDIKIKNLGIISHAVECMRKFSDPYHTGKQAGFLNGDKSTRSSSDQSGIPRLAKSPETERRGEKNSRKE